MAGLTVAAGLALGAWVAVRARPVYAVYTWGSILFFLCAEWPGRPLASEAEMGLAPRFTPGSFVDCA